MSRLRNHLRQMNHYYIEYTPEAYPGRKLWLTVRAETEDEARFLAEPLMATQLSKLGYADMLGVINNVQRLA